MDPFPALDPIPLPAPVWLFKVLHPLTFSLHIAGVQILLGSLAIASVWAFAARLRRDSVQAAAAAAVVRPLPILMTFVINLGVPPLLFSQVLYGRALYTSSILIGLWWIAVIVLLMAGYHLLYLSGGRAGKGRFWGWTGLIALVLFLKIALIYSHNFTLLARPEAWPEMYANSAIGARLSSGDATLTTRWLFLMAGALALGGVGIGLVGRLTSLRESTALFLRRQSGILVAVFMALQAGLAVRLFLLHAPELRGALLAAPLSAGALGLWGLSAGALMAAGFLGTAKAAARALWPILAAVIAGLANVASMVIIREALRDAALLKSGFDVWERRVDSNWVVVGLFVVLLLAGVGGLVWLIRIAIRGGAPDEAPPVYQTATQEGGA